MHRIPAGTSAPKLLAVCAVLAAITCSLWHIMTSRACPSFDEAWYLENSFRFYHALRTEGAWAFLRAYAVSFRLKAPLIAVLPLPMYVLFGPSVKAALSVNLVGQGLLGYYVFRLGQRCFNDVAAAMSVFIAMTLPLLFGLSRVFFVETWLAAIVTAFAWHLCASDGLRRRGEAVPLGVLSGAGMLIKSMFPMYILGPVADILWRRLREGGRTALREMEGPIKIVLGLGGAIALSWYAFNGVTCAGFMLKAGFGDIGAHYAGAGLLGYWTALIREGVSQYYFAAAVVALVWLRARGARFKDWWGDPGMRMILLWFVVPLLIASFGVNREPRYAAAALPAFALLLGGAVERLVRGRPRAWLMFGLFCLFPAGQFMTQTFGQGPLPLRRFLPAETTYARPPAPPVRWDAEGLAERLAAAAGDGAVIAIGLEHAGLNANLLACYAALHDRTVAFMNLGHMEANPERAIVRLMDRGADHLVFVDGMPQEELLPSARRLDPALRELVRNGKLPFRIVETYDLAPGLTATLWKRTAPLRIVGVPPGA
ncbi:MAG: glycosyltransferase family 39 protein [Elusimicrobiota bacterium]